MRGNNGFTAKPYIHGSLDAMCIAISIAVGFSTRWSVTQPESGTKFVRVWDSAGFLDRISHDGDGNVGCDNIRLIC